MGTDMKTVLNQAVKILEKAGVETPQLDAEVLLAHALGCERHELYTATTRYLVPGGKEKVFEGYVERRCRREPVAYIRGFKEFWSINIKVTPAVLIPRPETEAVVEKAVELMDHGLWTMDRGPKTILDLCTGSGCIAAALATELPGAQITVADISEEALKIARQNLKFAKGRVTFLQSNLFEKIPLPSTGKFDLIVSNPPYIPTAQCNDLMPEVSKFEPRIALDGGRDGLDFVRKIRQDAHNFLKPNGWLVIENGPEIETWKN